ncbi:hypothetical protein B5S28_g360 [[Candida] boidinii]|nr:hypothetical protein B5S28_g360 [[Candida] boidinii]OWB71176.1 hypothetical protein B5S31_g861 [[Candida] boidinii]OWB76999.1 hypothetical protein B5S32_g1157 [[Candida] boidinii]
MSINFDTFRALEIFENNSTGQKGCKSLFNLLNQTSCKIGREKLYSAILRPTTDIKILKNRFDTIDIILKEISIKRDENSMQSIISSCKSLPVITSTIKTFNNSLQKTSIWNQIRSYITNIINIFDSIDNSEELKESIYFRNYLDVFDKSLMNSLLEMINSTIDWNAESLNPQTISVLPGVDPQLAEYRATYNDMEIILDGTAKEISRRFDKMVADIITVAYIPQLGFLVALDSNEETEEFIDANITSSWFEVFSTGTTKYFKNETVEALDSKFGDVYSLICDAEIDILSILQDEIMKHSDILLKVYNAIGDIDMMISLAKASLHLGFNRPTMVEEPILNISDMTHPFFKDSYVRNSLKLNNYATDINRSENVAVITGPNFSGKSTILKQCGLLVFLAHIGCFVPSTSATIGITDAILTRMQNPEILDKPQSTFFSDCQQMSNCLNFSTQKSLLLIDEFGTGTDVYDGPALLIAAINNLISREGSPRSIIATNFFEILKDENSFLEKKPLLYYMRTVLESVSSSKEISYLYQLTPGVTTTTYGIICAKHCGIAADIIKRAEEIQETSKEYDNVHSSTQEEMSHIETSIKLHLTQNIDTSLNADELRRGIQALFKF